MCPDHFYSFITGQDKSHGQARFQESIDVQSSHGEDTSEGEWIIWTRIQSTTVITRADLITSLWLIAKQKDLYPEMQGLLTSTETTMMLFSFCFLSFALNSSVFCTSPTQTRIWIPAHLGAESSYWSLLCLST